LGEDARRLTKSHKMFPIETLEGLMK